MESAPGGRPGGRRERGRVGHALAALGARHARHLKPGPEIDAHDEELAADAVLAGALEGIAYIGPDDTVERADTAFAMTLGTTREQLIGSQWDAAVHEMDRERLDMAHRVMRTEGRGTAAVRGLRRDGSTFSAEVTLLAHRGTDGERLGHFCFLRDTTRQQQPHLDDLFLISPDLLCVTDLNGRLLRVNPTWTAVLGHLEVDLIGQEYLDLVHPDDIPATLETMAHSSDGRQVLAFENRFRCADGEYRSLRWHSTVDRSRGVIYAVAHDVTSTKQLTGDLARARDDALEASRVKSQFLATMSHEIRTPMSGVIGLAGLLGDTPLTDEQRRLVDGIRTAGDALLSVINDILDFSKLEAGKLVLDEVDFTVTTLAEDVQAINAQNAADHGLALQVDVDPRLPATLCGDPGRIRQILFNLVGNAIKFTRTGTVSLRVRPARPEDLHDLDPTTYDDRTYLVLEVEDTGIGMDAETQARIFQPFNQADGSTTRVYGGTGLGLSISRQIAHAMGGSLTVRSEPGRGSCFTAVLPLHEATPGEVSAATDSETLHVLVADDNGVNRQLLATQIEAWGMYVDTVADAEEALELLGRGQAHGNRYDVALIDLHMPGMSGLELADAIVANPGIPDLPVILMTSGDEIVADVARRAHVGAHITKPVTPSVLLDALTRLTTPAPAPATRRAAHRGRVLLVEDNDINQLVAQGILGRLGYDVDIADDGLIALSMAAGQPYQAILMDCQMPNMDGYTATRRLRKNPATARIPIIAMTANAFKADRDRCIEAGMDDFLTKPIRAHDLDSALTRWTTSAPLAVRPERAEGSTGIPERIEELRGENTPQEVVFVGHVLAAARRTLPTLMEGLTAAVLARDGAAVAYQAHQLKGAAANVGAEVLADICRTVVEAARNDRLDDALTHVSRLDAAFDQAMTEIDALTSLVRA